MESSKTSVTFAVISDTHGRISKQALEIIKDVDGIIHCGDIGSQEVINTLEKIGQVLAVRGNMDMGQFADDLPETGEIDIGDLAIYVIHDLKDLNIDLSRFKIVLHGHTHKPSAKKKDGILYLNPGSISMPKQGMPATSAILKIDQRGFDFKFVTVK